MPEILSIYFQIHSGIHLLLLNGNLKQALIATGLEILSDKGIEGLSLRKVAKRVGVSHTAPYNHFPDKQALLAAICFGRPRQV